MPHILSLTVVATSLGGEWMVRVAADRLSSRRVPEIDFPWGRFCMSFIRWQTTGA